MRLLMTTDTVGGVWTFTTELTRQLLMQGHSVHLVSFGRKPSADQVATQGELQAGYSNHFQFTNSEIPLEWMQNNEGAHLEGEELLRSVLQTAAAPDLIVSNQFCFGRLDSPIPRVVVAHSDVLSWARACKQSALDATPWLNRYTSMVQGGILDAAALIAPTAWMGKMLVSSFFLPRNYFVIPNGASVEAAPDPEPERRLQAITAGRLWDEAKGLDTLRDVRSPIPVLVAGDAGFEDAEHSFDLPESVSNLGPLSRSALHLRFRESAICLCTSRYEPFGLAPLEAALCGCALVLRDLPSLREVWSDSALYFSDAASLEGVLHSLANDPALLAEAQARAGRRARQFTPERMASSYLHLFQTVVQQQAAPHVA